MITNRLLILTFFIGFYFSLTHAYGIDEPKLYHPEIRNILTFPPSHHASSDSDFKIYSTVLDKYSEIKNATLTYTDNKYNITHNLEMELINGTLSNGTFRAVIPKYSPQYYEYNISYALTFRDRLNYIGKYSDWYVIHKDDQKPKVDDYGAASYFNEVTQGFTTTIQVGASDAESGIRNVTFYYRTNPPLLNSFAGPFRDSNATNSIYYGIPWWTFSKSSIRMSLVDGDKWNGLYQGIIPALSSPLENGSFRVYDGAGLHTVLNKTNFIYYRTPWWTKILNTYFTDTEILGVNTQSKTANLSINVEAPVVNKSDIYGFSEFIKSPIATLYRNNQFRGFIYVLQSYSDLFPRESNLTSLGMSKPIDRPRLVHQIVDHVTNSSYHRDISVFTGKPQIGIVPLLGDPSLYPFDHPYVDFNISFPSLYPMVILKNQTVRMSSLINDTWMGTPKTEFDGFEYTVHVEFHRNYTILGLAIPLLAIFYLLGAIFIFENSSDQVGNRLTLTLGIFALIFTLPEIINSMKPESPVPTIADSLLSLIIIATIVFTLSSIISSSSVIQKWFPRRFSWIDMVMFLLVSGFVIGLLSNYDPNVTLWLIPIVIFGLGYGLLLKILGVRVTKPIWSVLFSPKTKQ